MKKTYWVLCGGLAFALAAGAGVWIWRNAVERAGLERTLTVAEQAHAAGRWIEARAVLEDQARRRGRPDAPEASRRWLNLEFAVAGGLRDFDSLEALAARDPSLVAADEMGALWLWRIRRTAAGENGAEEIRAVWRGRETVPVLWACAEIDAWIVEGKLAEARAALTSLPANVAGAVPLLLRKAAIETDPAAAFGAMTEAYRANPADADLRSLRAGLLERRGQTEYAQVDYVAALVADTGNPLRRDELASFYLRQGDLMAAVETWREGLDERSPDYMWVRAVFWGRVAGLATPEAAAKLSPERSRRFAGWLAGLPENRYWDEAGYAALNLPSGHAAAEPAVFWLRVLENLRQGEWAAAETLLAAAPRAASATAPNLLAALRATLAVRAGAQPARTGIAWPATGPGAHRWWALTAAALKGDPQAGEEFLRTATGPLAAPAVLLAAGWPGPALALADPAEAAAPAAPEWVRYGLLQARRMVRGPEDALAWGETLPPYPETDYTVAALRLGAGRAGEAEPVLRELAARSDDTGYAAAWLLGTWLLEQGRAGEVPGLLAKAPALKATPEGVALSARAGLARGDVAGAAALYETIAETSLEAGAYLARSAFEAGELARARRLTEFWLGRMPSNLQLRANLEAVAEAEAKAAAKEGR